MQRLCDQHFQATTDARCGRTLFKASQTFRIYSSKSWKTSKSEQIWFENNRKTQLRVHIRLTAFPGLKKLTLYVQKGSPAADSRGSGKGLWGGRCHGAEAGLLPAAPRARSATWWAAGRRADTSFGSAYKCLSLKEYICIFIKHL